MKKAVVLLSGGLDSATTLYIARKRGYSCFCLIFDYGQRHRKEITSARALAKRTSSRYEIIKLRLPEEASALTSRRIPIPQKRSLKTIGKNIPPTYVPARNIVFLGIALSYAESLGAKKIFIGANALDFSGYPDCRPRFFSAFSKAARTGTKAGKSIRIETPLLNKTKSSIIRAGTRLGVPYNLTWSCYRGKRKPCGTCDSCLLREKGFAGAGMKDPLL